MDDEKLISPREVAERCSVDVGTVWRWIRMGKLPAVQLGRNYRVSVSALRAFLHEQEV